MIVAYILACLDIWQQLLTVLVCNHLIKPSFRRYRKKVRKRITLLLLLAVTQKEIGTLFG